MEDEIQKFISEYTKKIANVDILLNQVKVGIQQARRAKEDYTHLRTDQARLFAQLNAYHQVQADFDSLLDYV